MTRRSLLALVLLAGCRSAHHGVPCKDGPGVYSCQNDSGTCRESFDSPEFKQDCAEKKGTYSSAPCPTEAEIGSCALVVDGGPRNGEAFAVKFYSRIPAGKAKVLCDHFGGKYTEKPGVKAP